MLSSSYLTVLIANESDPSPDRVISHTTWNRLKALLRSESLAYTLSDGGRFIAYFEDDRTVFGSIEKIAKEVRRISSENGKAARVEVVFSSGTENHSGRAVEKKRHLGLFLYRNQMVWELSKTRPALTIGRSPICDVPIFGIGGSRQHARIELTESGCILVDTSRSGTLVYHADGRALLIGGRMRLPESGVISFPWDERAGETSDPIIFGALSEDRKPSPRARVGGHDLRADMAPWVPDQPKSYNEMQP